MSSIHNTVATLLSHSPVETENIGRKLGAVLNKGSFIALYGDLGGGKTCFTRGLVAAAAPESQHLVASPTFAIMNEYPGKIPVYHFDFYRLGGPQEIIELGFDDFFQGDGICVAEWSERLGDLLPGDTIKITFEHSGNDLRKISFSSDSDQARELITQFSKQLKTEEFL